MSSFRSVLALGLLILSSANGFAQKIEQSVGPLEILPNAPRPHRPGTGFAKRVPSTRKRYTGGFQVRTDAQTTLQTITYHAPSFQRPIQKAHLDPVFEGIDVLAGSPVPFGGPNPPPMNITVPNSGYVDISILARDITYGSGGPSVPVRLSFTNNGGTPVQFMDATRSVAEVEINDTNKYSLQSGEVIFTAESAYPDFTNHFFHFVADSEGMNAITITNQSPELNLQNILTARGVQVPFGAPGGMQQTIAYYLPPDLLDSNGNITLAPGEILMFFELGTSNQASSAYDFQDLIVRVKPSPLPCVDDPLTGFGGGSGTQADPYVVCSADHLDVIRSLSPSFHYVQTSDIDLSDNPNFLPLNQYNSPFTASYDGQMFSISNATMNFPIISNVGLFGRIGQNGIVRNLVARNFQINGNMQVGTITAVNEGLIEHVKAENTNIHAGENTGGIAGYNYGTISKSSSSGQVHSSSSITGGIVGLGWDNSAIYNSFSSASISSMGGLSGGLAGALINATISNCYSVGSVSGGSDNGGLVGIIDGSINVVASFWNTETSGQLTSAVGIGKTTSELQTQSTFGPPSWDFQNIWSIIEGVDYPRLR